MKFNIRITKLQKSKLAMNEPAIEVVLELKGKRQDKNNEESRLLEHYN